MGPHPLLLLLLGQAGWGWAGSLPETLQVTVGSLIRVQCRYRPQDATVRKVWCRILPEGCQPVASSTVDRGVGEDGRTFLTDMGSGLLQVEMFSLMEEDAGLYGCMVEGTSGPQIVHTVALTVLPEEKETRKVDFPGSSSNPEGVGPDEMSIPLLWGAVLLLGLLVVVVAVVLTVLVKRKGGRFSACGQFQSSTGSNTAPSSEVRHTSDAGLALALPSGVPYVRLDSPPSFDNTTYTSLPLDPPSGKPPPSVPLPPKVSIYSTPVTHAMAVTSGGDQGKGVSCEPAQDLPSSQSPPS